MDPGIDFHSFFETYKSAVLRKDVNLLMSLYSKDFTAFDMWDLWSHVGDVAWREMNEEWLSTLGSESVVVGFYDATVIPGDDVAAAYATVSYTAVSETGETLRSMDNRLSWVAKRESGVWKIIHQHTSAPLNSGTMTAILHR